MHIKFISTGKGSASAAKDYLLQKEDHKGITRAGVQVLRGNPDHVTQLAESLDFKHKYTSAVIAWHKDDAPTDKQIAQVLDDFERVAFAGLDPSQYAYYAVQHEDADGAKHIHIITPRVELSTGKSLNIAPPNWQKTYDVLVDKYNVQHDWASPKDISRQKTMTIDKMQIHADTSNVQAKKMIHEVINELVERGNIKNNTDVRTKLAEFGEITREGKDYISLKPKGFKKAIRLKGAYYEREFSIERVSKEVRAEQEARARANQGDRSREYERIGEVLESIIADRAKFNQGKYLRSPKVREHQEQVHSREQRSVQQSDREELQGTKRPVSQNKSQAMDNTNSHGDSHSPSPSVGNVGNYQVPNAPTPNTSRTKRSTESNKELQASSESMGQRDRDKKGLSSETGEDKRGNILFKTGGIDHDAIRERVKGNYQDTRRDIQRRITESNDSLREEYRANKHSVQQSDERSVSSDRTAESNVKQVREHINELANQYRRETSSKLRELIRKAEGRVGELAASVRQFGKKAIEKVKGLKHRLEKFHKEQGVKKSTSRSHGRGGMSR